MHAFVWAMSDQLVIIAASLHQSIGKNGHSVESTFIVNGTG